MSIFAAANIPIIIYIIPSFYSFQLTVYYIPRIVFTVE